jgi:hypothetical protein
MGATIIDGILQAGLNYDNVVKPRVEKFKSEYPNCTTTSQFADLINKEDLSAIVNMKGQKIDRIKLLVKFLKTEKIETEDDFYDWLSIPENLVTLATLKGIKDKTIDYFKILTGHKNTVAIDVRLINFIKLALPVIKTISYEDAHELLMLTAKELKVEASTLDYSIWKYMSGKGNNKALSTKEEPIIEKRELDQLWNGYCPESWLKGKNVRMRLNKNDFYESEETGLQIAVLTGVQAIILKHRGNGQFKMQEKYADEIENGELLSPQNSDRMPFNNPTTIFKDSNEIEQYLNTVQN